MTAAVRRERGGALRVLDVEVRPGGDDGSELFVRGEVPEPRPFPVYELTVRVALTSAVERGEPAPGDTEEAAGLLLGAERQPWWKRGWRRKERR